MTIRDLAIAKWSPYLTNVNVAWCDADSVCPPYSAGGFANYRGTLCYWEYNGPRGAFKIAMCPMVSSDYFAGLDNF